VTPPRVTITIDELVVDQGEDVAAAVRAELAAAPAQTATFDAVQVASAVAAAVERETGS